MKYTKKQFFVDVAKEVESLKKNATKEEIERLNITTLMPSKKDSCIYGQMTGDCTTARAIELIGMSCQRYINTSSASKIRNNGIDFIQGNINGTSIPRRRSGFDVGWFSTLEAYIVLPEAKNKNIIAYLKGEKKTLVL